MPEDHLNKYSQQFLIQYPVNVGRNIAKEAATTHYVLASDIELYPSPGFIGNFLNMIKTQGSNASSVFHPRVYPLGVFEVRKEVQVPESKSELVHMLENGNATIFHALVSLSK